FGVVRRHAVGFPIQDQAFPSASRRGITSLKKGEIDHAFDAFTASPARTIYSPEEWHFGMCQVVLGKGDPEMVGFGQMSKEKLPFAERTRRIGRNFFLFVENPIPRIEIFIPMQLLNELVPPKSVAHRRTA